MPPVDRDSWLIEHNKVIEPLYRQAATRRVFPVVPEAEYFEKEFEYWSATADFVHDYALTPSFRTSRIDLSKATKEVPAIKMGFSYTPYEVEQICNSRFVLDRRVSLFRKEFAKMEDLYVLGGTTKALDGTDNASLVTTGTNSTAVSSNANVTTMAGIQSMLGVMVADVENNGIEVGANPLILVLTPDVIVAIHKVVNQYTDLSGRRWLMQELKSYNAQSDLVVSPYLGATYTIETTGKVSVTEGTTNALLNVWNPDYAFVLASPITPAEDYNPIDGLRVSYEERWLNIYLEKKGLIYDSSVTVS